MNTYTVTVSIGRNVGDVPMPIHRWRQFQMDTHGVIADSVFEKQIEFIERHVGEGSWDGVTEDSVKITFGLKSALTEEALDSLRHTLTGLARFYDQDAIALTIGQSELIYAREGVSA